MASLSQFANLFCANCMEVTLHRKEQCITCHPDETPPPRGSWVNSPIGHHRSSVWKKKGHGPSLTVKGQSAPTSARERNEQRLHRAMQDPRVGGGVGGEGE